MISEEKQKNWFRRHWIVSIFLGFVVLGMIGALFGEDDSNTTGDVVNQPNNQQEEKLVEDISESAPSTETKTTLSEKLIILNHDLTYGDYGNLIISGSAKNVAGRKLSYASIDVKFYDSDRAVIGTSLDNINNLEENEIWKFEVYYLGLDTYNVDDYSIEVGSVW